MTFFTVGHSTDTLEDFVARLQTAGVTTIVDVRTLAGSNRFPHFNSEVFEVELPKHHIVYQRIQQLGGLRKREKNIAPEVNGFWQNRSFHNYADYTLSTEFADGLAELISLAGPPPSESNVAVMCAEAVWWRCHRRIIADNLIARGHTVKHIMPQGKLADASLTPGAVIDPPPDEHHTPRVLYPAGPDG